MIVAPNALLKSAASPIDLLSGQSAPGSSVLYGNAPLVIVANPKFLFSNPVANVVPVTKFSGSTPIICAVFHSD